MKILLKIFVVYDNILVNCYKILEGLFNVIVCPKCNKPNDDNTKCIYCGADLSEINNETNNEINQAAKDNPSSTAAKTPNSSSNSEKIMNLAIGVGFFGALASIILGFIFPSVTSSSGHYSSSYSYDFNWSICLSCIIALVFFVIILVAMSYIAKAIEEK